MSNLADLVPIPTGINHGLSPPQEDTILDKFGRPGALTDKCSPFTGVKAHIKYGINALMAPADYGHAMGYDTVLGEG
jgi:hypothetical protein